MSRFTDAIEQFKRKIAEIGSKEYHLNKEEDWLKTRASEPSVYSDNVLQAAFNIADTLHTAANANAFTARTHLAANYSSLAKWFKYFEPDADTGTLQIINEKTAELGVAMKAFLAVVISDSDAQGLLSAGISRLRNIHNELGVRLSRYRAERAFEPFQQQLNTDINQLPNIPIPAFIVNHNGTWSYQMTLSTRDDPTARLEANQTSYTLLIEGLHGYLRELNALERALGDQHDHFITAHPIPKEADSLSPQFIAARETACVQLLKRHQGVKKHMHEITALLAEAKRGFQAINDELVKGSLAGRNELLHRLAEEVASAASALQASQHDYLEASTSIAAISDRALHGLQALAENRKAFLINLNRELEEIERGLCLTPPRLPERETLTSKLEYSTTASKSPIELLYQKMTPQTTSTIVGALKRLATPPNDAIIILTKHVREKRARIALELAIDITNESMTERPPVLTFAKDNLYTLKEQYQLQLNTAKERNRSLGLLELQVIQDERGKQQALLAQALTQLEFRLADIKRQQQSLQGLLPTLNAMPTEEALNALEENNDDLLQLIEWFSPPKEGSLSNATLLESIDALHTSLNDLSLREHALIERVNDLPLPRFKERKDALDRVKESLVGKTSSIHAQYIELQQLMQTLLLKRKALQLQKLTAIIASMSLVIERMAGQALLDLAQKKQLLADVLRSLTCLSNNEDFFAALPSQDSDIATMLEQLHAFRNTLTTSKESLQQNIKQRELAQFKETFFGKNREKMEGVFGSYLQERAHTFWLKDLFSQFAALVFGCFGYQTEASKRKDFIVELEDAVTAYQTEPERKYADLRQTIDAGTLLFTSSRRKSESLQGKLMTFQTRLQAIHRGAEEEREEPSPHL